MGKETNGSRFGKRHAKLPTPHTTKQYVQQIANQQWASTAASLSVNDVSENGTAGIIVEKGGAEIGMVCRGLKFKGNSYKDLIKALENNMIIPKDGVSVSIFARKEFLWQLINENKDVYDSGDSVLIRINQKVQKSIRKLK